MRKFFIWKKHTTNKKRSISNEMKFFFVWNENNKKIEFMMRNAKQETFSTFHYVRDAGRKSWFECYKVRLELIGVKIFTLKSTKNQNLTKSLDKIRQKFKNLLEIFKFTQKLSKSNGNFIKIWTKNGFQRVKRLFYVRKLSQQSLITMHALLWSYWQVKYQNFHSQGYLDETLLQWIQIISIPHPTMRSSSFLEGDFLTILLCAYIFLSNFTDKEEFLIFTQMI